MSKLYKACSESEYKSVYKILKLEKKLNEPDTFHKAKGVDVDYRHPKTKETSLMAAVRSNSLEIIEALILCSAQPDLRNEVGKTALHIAMERSAPESIIKAVMKGKADVNLRDRDQNTPLHLACIQDYTVGIILLLQNKAKYKMLNGGRRTCLDEAAVNNCGKACGIIVEEEGMSKNISSLFHAVNKEFNDIVSILLEGGVDVNAKNEDDLTALHVAVERGDVALIDILLYHSASGFLAGGADNKTSMELARKFPNQETSEILVKKLENADQIEKYVSKKGELVFEREATYDYPMMKSKVNWAGSGLPFESSNTNETMWALLDNDPTTYCEMIYYKEKSNFWMFDLKRKYKLNGVQIGSYDSMGSLKIVNVEAGESFNGPWKLVRGCEIDKMGATDYKNHKGTNQSFMDFKPCETQYIRFNILENWGGFRVVSSGINFYGIDCKIEEYLHKFKIDHLLPNLIKLQYLHVDDLWILKFKEEQSREICRNNTQDIVKLRDMIRYAHSEHNKLTYLALGPGGSFPVKHVQNKRLPDLVIEGPPGCDDEIELFFEDNKMPIEGGLKTHLVPDIERGGASIAKFRNIVVNEDGTFFYGIRAVNKPEILCGNLMYDITLDILILQKDQLMDSVADSLAMFDV